MSYSFDEFFDRHLFQRRTLGLNNDYGSAVFGVSHPSLGKEGGGGGDGRDSDDTSWLLYLQYSYVIPSKVRVQVFITLSHVAVILFLGAKILQKLQNNSSYVQFV